MTRFSHCGFKDGTEIYALTENNFSVMKISASTGAVMNIAKMRASGTDQLAMEATS